MLNFDQKLAVIASFEELQRNDVSLGRVNFQYEDSLYDRKNVIYHLHPNGNGYVYAGLLNGYPTDDKGLVNIRDFSEESLRTLIREAIDSLSRREEAPEPKPSRRRKKVKEEEWYGLSDQKLILKLEDDMWYIYSGLNLEMAFETYEEAVQYMDEEGFARS
ncbi:hypothetical protein [Paenibacillus radicis (ex Gao et al. 2016)]|uniref:Uncharacterized protein n=1 Tax=Paenibacillus radicis (ex Gao et al. 2016) TaxID=1737354 RepID=A0A917HET6_9BACL|nr:hypothetical protein [Paenibacillus radicis (ex Gao et al. 2016)]GGG76261.1 hypothetical protein GCM10010918_35950 [Paenibacillus radicis (ex Gao et al. 2016)]